MASLGEDVDKLANGWCATSSVVAVLKFESIHFLGFFLLNTFV